MKPCQTRPSSTTATRRAEHAEPDPQRDPADLAAAGDQLGGAGQEQGHQQQGDGAAEADTGQRGLLRASRRAAGPRGAGVPNPGEETGGMSGPFGRLAATVQYHQSHPSQRSRRAGHRSCHRGARIGRGSRGYRLRHGRPSRTRPRGRRRARTTTGSTAPGARASAGTPVPRRAPTTPPGCSRPAPERGRSGSPRPRADPDAADGRPARQLALGGSAPLGRPYETPPPARPRATAAGRAAAVRSPPGRAPAAVATVPRPAPVPARLAQGACWRSGWSSWSPCPCSPGRKIDKVDATPSGDRPDVAARDDVPPGRQRQPRGADPQAAAGVRRRQGPRAGAPTRSCCCTPAPAPTC